MTFNIPKATPETEHFWNEAKESRLTLPFCLDTKQFFFYPRSFSPFTGTRNVEWRQVSGKATLHSYIINHRPLPGSESLSPVIALVKLDEGPVMMSNIVDIEPDPKRLTLDMKLQVKFEQVEGMSIPVFTPEGSDRGL